MKLTYKRVWGERHNQHVHDAYQHPDDAGYPVMDPPPAKQKFCCGTMEGALTGVRGYPWQSLSMQEGYEGVFRLAFTDYGHFDDDDKHTPINFCPWCGERIDLESIGNYEWFTVPTGKKIKVRREITMPTTYAEVEVDETVPELRLRT